MNWFCSYLSGRKLQVKIKSNDGCTINHSKWHDYTHGTPQGSCLGPLLFLVFCNDLRLNLEYLSCIQFADDTTLYYADKSLDVLKCCIEHDLKIIMDWFRANSLTLNIEKTKYLLFAPTNKKKTINLMIDNCIIKPSNHTKFLGVILDDKLEWTHHVKNVLTKMKQNSSLMRLSRNILSKHGLKIVYYAHIYSHMTYCISVWGSMTNVTQMAKLTTQQNNCMRMLEKKPALIASL